MKRIRPFSSVKPLLTSVLFGLCALSTTGAAYAEQNWPSRPLKMLVGFNAGGTTDVVARVIAHELDIALGHPVVVENKPGAGSNIASDMAMRAKPDGYTLYMVAVTAAINQTLYKNVRFDLKKDYAPIALAVKVPNVLVVNPKLPVNTVQELVQYAKDNPDKLNFSSSGSGTSIHMAGELFKQLADVQVTHIPYSGSAPAITDLIGGQVDYTFDNMPSAWPHVEAGTLRALAVTTDVRSESAPELPTMQESGFPTFEVSSWFGLVAPAGTPDEITERINQAMQTALSKPEVIKRLNDLGAVPQYTSREEFGKFLADEVDGWRDVVITSGAQVD